MNRAEVWMKKYARPLEMAMWEYFFREGSRDAVIDYLQAFQNDDGGFGHGLEPDFWLPHSSPMATWNAGQILVEVGASQEEPIVQKLIAYLVATPQVRPGMWPSVLPEYNDYPHAPWWHWQENAQDGWMFNPSVELAAFLIHWSQDESTGAQLGWGTLAHALRHVMDSAKMERHELNNYGKCLRLLRPHKGLFDARMEYPYDEVQRKVDALTSDVIDRDVTSWAQDYLPLPLDFISGPDNTLYPDFKELVDENIRFYLDQRTNEGIWNITWNWGQYPEAFAVASRYWQGILAVERYKILKAFGEER